MGLTDVSKDHLSLALQLNAWSSKMQLLVRRPNSFS